MPKRIPGDRVDKEEALRKQRLLVAFKKHNCLVTIACKHARTSTTTYYEYLERDEKFAEDIATLKEGVIDFVESSLFKSIQKGEYVPAMFYLKCQAKKRGYIEKQEIKISGDRENPIVPDSIVAIALDSILGAERERLKNTPLEDF